MKLYTSKEYANQTLILPIVGQIQLDKEASFECDADKAQQVIKATENSIEFSNLIPGQQKLKVQGDLKQNKGSQGKIINKPVSVVPTKKELEQAKATLTVEQQKQIDQEAADYIDVETVVEAIDQAEDNELKELISFVPGISEQDVVGFDSKQLRQFLKAKAIEAGQNQGKR